jgi:hypothetical protein
MQHVRKYSKRSGGFTSSITPGNNINIRQCQIILHFKANQYYKEKPHQHEYIWRRIFGCKKTGTNPLITNKKQGMPNHEV